MNQIRETAYLLWVLVINFGTNVVSKSSWQGPPGEDAPWFVLILVSFNPADIECNWEVSNLMLDPLKDVVVSFEVIKYRGIRSEMPFKIFCYALVVKNKVQSWDVASVVSACILC
jgi:hypothetical protein